MESFHFEDRIQERIESYRRRPGCRTAFYLVATYVLSEIFYQIAMLTVLNSYLLTQRTVVFSVCCMGGFLLHEIHRYYGKPPAGEEESSSEDRADP